MLKLLKVNKDHVKHLKMMPSFDLEFANAKIKINSSHESEQINNIYLI